jgi:phytol kinase
MNLFFILITDDIIFLCYNNDVKKTILKTFTGEVMSNLWGINLSLAFIFVIIFLSTLLNKTKILSEEGSRKFIHIGVGNWWIIAMLFFSNVIYASIVPFLFIVLNYLSYRFKIVKAMERENDKSLGTVYYPVSLLILVIFTFGIIDRPYIGAIGIFIMAYGDGLASVFGKMIPSPRLYGKKTLAGSLAMFIVSAIVTATLLLIFHPVMVVESTMIVALSATLLELYSKKGLDNITVPLGSSLIYYLLTLI